MGNHRVRFWRTHKRICEECGTFNNISRHHLKNWEGKKTGEIKVLCRRCHDKAEEQYRLYGITKPHHEYMEDDQWDKVRRRRK